MIDPAHSRAPFPAQTQGRVQRLFERSRPETREWPSGEGDVEPLMSNLAWRLLQIVVYGAALALLAYLLLESKR